MYIMKLLISKNFGQLFVIFMLILTSLTSCSVWSDISSILPFGNDDPVIEDGEENEWEIITVVTTFPEDALIKIFAITNFVREPNELQSLVEDLGLLDHDLQDDYEKQLLQISKNPSEYEEFYEKAINFFIDRKIEEKVVYYQSKGALKPNKNIFFGTDEFADSDISQYAEYYKVYYKKANYEKDNLILKWEFYRNSFTDLCVYFDENRQAIKNVYFTDNKITKEEYFVALRKWITKYY